MSRLKIKNFGPIKDGLQGHNGWIELDKMTVFIGNQSSGKSTVAKLFATLSWLEKSINRGDTNKDNLSFSHFIDFTRYQQIHNFFKEDTYIEYMGDQFHIIFDKTKPSPVIKEVTSSHYVVPKIMYIPAERNLLSTISNAYSLKGLPDNLFAFAKELKIAQKALKGKKTDLHLGSYQYEYNENNDNSYVIGKDHKINLIEASSGLQSFTPMFLVAKNLTDSISEEEAILKKNLSVTQSIRMDNEIADVMQNSNIPEDSKSVQINKIRDKYYNRCFINIVEEPEQNLFPISQWEMLKNLLRFNNHPHNRLLITTHSPYLVNYLAVIIKAGQLNSTITSTELKRKIEQIVPSSSMIQSNKVHVYEFNEDLGEINLLEDYKGLPSDDNYLNLGLADSNNLFANLLDIEDLWQ